MLDKQKYFEELYEVESKDIPTHSFLSRDFGVKKDCKYFIETGTHLGHGVQYALDHGFENIFKFLGFGLFPILLFFFLFGIFKIFRKIDQKKLFIILIGITLLIPAFYAYARDFQDIKFLLIMYPIFSLLSLYIIEKIHHRIIKTNFTSMILLLIIIISSIVILEMDKNDYEYERDVFIVANKVVEIADGYLVYSPESKYIKAAEAQYKWPDVLPNNKDGHVIRDKTLRFEIDFSENNLSWKYNLGEETLSSKKFDTVYELFSSLEQEGLTHIIIDEKENRAKFLNEVFLNPKKFPFLKEVYNSSSEQLLYNVKIQELNFNKSLTTLRNFYNLEILLIKKIRES